MFYLLSYVIAQYWRINESSYRTFSCMKQVSKDLDIVWKSNYKNSKKEKKSKDCKSSEVLKRGTYIINREHIELFTNIKKFHCLLAIDRNRLWYTLCLDILYIWHFNQYILGNS